MGTSRSVVFLLLLTLFLPPLAEGSWRISPTRIDLDPRSRSGNVAIVNEGEDIRHFAVEAAAWSQDEEGNDLYEPTEELVFFPRRLSVPPGEERVVRAGVRVPPADRERAYRLYIQEDAPPRMDGQTGVAIVLRFGVPVYVRPASQQVAGEISARIENGEARLSIANRGNVHFRIRNVSLEGRGQGGEAIFSESLAGGTVLSGAARLYSLPLPAEICSRLREIAIEAETDRTPFRTTVAVDEAGCRP